MSVVNAVGDEEYEYLLSMERQALDAAQAKSNGVTELIDEDVYFDLETDIPSQKDVEAYLLNRRKQVRHLEFWNFVIFIVVVGITESLRSR